jgi:hypothetical protein
MESQIVIDEVFKNIYQLAKKYYKVTGKPLGVVGEVGEFVACKFYGGKLNDPRNAGSDFTKDGNMYEVKTRMIYPATASNFWNGATGNINISDEWNFLIVLILNDDFSIHSMYELSRKIVLKELNRKISNDLANPLKLSLSFVKNNGLEKKSPNIS